MGNIVIFVRINLKDRDSDKVAITLSSIFFVEINLKTQDRHREWQK